MLQSWLLASVIPFILWLIQKITGNTGSRATYLRRRIFAIGLLIAFLLNLFGAILLIREFGSDAKSASILSRSLGKILVFWTVAIWAGLQNKPNDNKGFIYAIWQPYKPEYIADKNKISKSEKKTLIDIEPEFLKDENEEGWLIDKKNIWCKKFYLVNNPTADLKQYVIEQTGKIIPNEPTEITKELKLTIKEAKSDWKYYLNDGWLPTTKKWD